MANKQLKGIKVNGTPYDINITHIGTHLTDGTKDYVIGVTEEGKLKTTDEDGNVVVAGTGDGAGVGITPEQAADIEQAKREAASALTIANAAQSAITAAGITVKVEEALTGNTLTVKNGAEDSCKLYINSFYCGAGADKNTEGYCSHNFVELSNLTGQDVDLDGITLQYLYNGQYTMLPLKGVIKNGSTFLIRGAQSSVIKEGFPRIMVEEPDMEWRIDSQNNYKVDGTLIEFAKLAEDTNIENDSPNLSFVLVKSTSKLTPTQNPWKTGSTDASLCVGYIDCVCINGGVAVEKSPFNGGKYKEVRGKMFRKYYAMDPVSQATKAFNKRNNANDIVAIDITKESGERIPSVKVYEPKAVKSEKDIFYNKTKLVEDKPTIITCSFGIQATYDDTEGAEKTATRCFNWVSKGNFNEYIWIRRKGDTTWGEAHESINGISRGDIKQLPTNKEYYHNRIVLTYSDGVIFTSHKYVHKGLTDGTYEYVAGHKDRFGNPILNKCTDVREFTVVKNSDITEDGFTFVQTSDQQGFNWEEYRVWEAASRTITDEDTDNKIKFMINTGDMTQSGNRMGEWLDYFGAKSEKMNNFEEMATVGNNDLSPADISKLCDGTDGSKLNLANYNFFYCSEIDNDNPPVFKVGAEYYFIPSLYSFNYGKVHFMCINSEIKSACESGDGSVYGFATSGNFYPYIKEWCEKDITKYKGDWNVAYCHELPFHILTTAITRDAVTACAESKDHIGGGEGRKGPSISLNIETSQQYWFSEFCQTHNIRLCIGGHKHTQSCTWPLLETVKQVGGVRKVASFKPTIVVSPTELFANYSGATSLVTVDGYKYPNTWVTTGATPSIKDDVYIKSMAAMSTFKLTTELSSGETPVVYSMSQATGYKHTSNKELPGDDKNGEAIIPWIEYVFPCTSGVTANGGQKHAFYTLWTIKDDEIIGDVRYVDGAMTGGKFDINTHGDNVARLYKANGDGSKIVSKNGLPNMQCAVNKTGHKANNDTHIVIKRVIDVKELEKFEASTEDNPTES